jgi:calcium permeable stress-gated cation channel
VIPALSYSIISPLVMGFATVGFALVYFAARYNSFFVLTNSVDTQGVAYARAMQQLMTGVYISEVCLLGLFAVNTAPGPIVLMAIFLGFTAVYHAVMRAALKPLTRYLPESIDGTDAGAVFNFSDHRSYDATKADGMPPSEVTPKAPGKLAAARGSLFTRLFNPQKFKSYRSTQAMIDSRVPPQYLAEEEELAYFNPSLTSQTPNLWIVRDEMGISRQECKDSGEVVTISDEYAHFNEKNKIIWDMETLEGSPESVPVYQKSIDY